MSDEGDILIIPIPDIRVGLPASPGQPGLSIAVPFMVLWNVYRALEEIDRLAEEHPTLKGAAMDIALIGARMEAAALQQTGTLHPAIEQLLIFSLLEAVQRYHRGQTKKEAVIAFTYELLRGRQINRKRAADIATVLLPEEKGITKDQWRKVVDRWAENKAPKVGIRKREKKQKSP